MRMGKKRAKSPDDPNATLPKRKERQGFEITFSVPKRLSVSATEAAAAKDYYTEDPYRDGEQSSQWGGKGAMPEPNLHIHITSHEPAQQISQQSPDAQALAEIALSFCQECRGWKTAYRINDWGYPYISQSVTKKLADTKIPPFERHFHYTHFDRVMEAVRDWLVTAPIARENDRMIAARSMRDALSRYFDGLMEQAELCRELMAACVEANRSRK
jgi:hypothetical protein